MRRKKLVFGVVGVVIIGAAAVLYSTIQPSGPAFIDPADQSLVMQGKAIYANNCAACHGEALQGQPNWRERMSNGRLPAPPHGKSGHTWHHPDALLVDMVKNGLVPGTTAPQGYVSGMPAYPAITTDPQHHAELHFITRPCHPQVL